MSLAGERDAAMFASPVRRRDREVGNPPEAATSPGGCTARKEPP